MYWQRVISTLFLVCIVLCTANAQTSLSVQAGEHTLIAPAYFGPNAFPVPDMTDGVTKANLTLDVAADGYFGTMQDRTATVFARLYVPLFTDRVNLTLWMPVYEWWQNSAERAEFCRIDELKTRKGSGAGDVFLSTDIMVLREKRFAPSILLRAALRTASGGDYVLARHYDSPGYFFDGTIGKSFVLIGSALSDEDDSEVLQLRIAGSAGFLCWQTGNGRQNDAVMYGLMAALQSKYVSLKAEWKGYVGWEGAGDRPMVILSEVRGNIKHFMPFVQYQYGIKDYPWHQVRIGLGYEIDVLSKLHKNKY